MWNFLGGLVSGGASLIGGINANQQNAQNTQQNNMWNYMMNLQNQQFQQQMSSTAYQRAVADMKAAGLNPAMMYGGSGGPASSPIGSVAKSEAPQVHDAVGPAVDRIVMALKLGNETNLNSALVQKAVQETATSASQAKVLDEEARTKNITNNFIADEMLSRIKMNVGSAKQSQAVAERNFSAAPGERYRSDLEAEKLKAFERTGDSVVGRNIESGIRMATEAARLAQSGLAAKNEVNTAKTMDELNRMLLMRQDSGSNFRPKPRFIPISAW